MRDSRTVFGDDDAEAATVRAVARLGTEEWPTALLAALARLRGDSHQAYLVGGTVRDVLLERKSDPAWDVATDRTPDEVTRLFARVEPIGIQHGTVLVLEEGLAMECTTFRREGGYPDARHPESVTFTRDPLADLARRDLTVNALAFDPDRGVLLDPFGGARDLERGMLRAVGDPLERFREDALRPLRTARFAATLAMTLESGTRAALGATRDRARQVALERVRDELMKLLAAPRPSVGLELLREAGLLALWMPELAACHGVPQNRFHAHDVYDHSLATCDAAPADKPIVRWAALLHDIGKPGTRVEREGEGTFYDHESVGAELAERMLLRLRFPGTMREAIVHLIRQHMFDYRSEWSDAALRRWLRRVGIDAVADVFDLRIADVIGNGLQPPFTVTLEAMRQRIERLIAEAGALSVTALEVNGHDVMRVLGVPPGPRVRAALEALLEEVLDRPDRNTREQLLARLEAWRDESPDSPQRA
jgi:tRNA nucleotidyltransferase (CCA-adding enzyme)